MKFLPVHAIVGSTMVRPVTGQLGEVSTGTIVGIVGGVIEIAAAAALVIAIIQKRKQRKRTESGMCTLH